MTPSDNLSLSQEERIEAAREVARGIVERFPRSYWLECARAGRPTEEMWTALGESGLLGLRVPEEYGGIGGSVAEMAAVVETLAEAGVPDTSSTLTAFARLPILEYGTPEQIERWVVPTVDGTQKMCFAVTEPDAGTNTPEITTRAHRTDRGWSISGQKVFISAAEESDSMLVLCRTDENGDRAELSLFVLETKTQGIEYTKLDIALVSPENQYLVFFDEVEVPEDALVGERGKGLRYLFDGLNPERIYTAAIAGGLGRYILRRGIEYAQERAPFGRPIGAYQAIQHPLAKAHAELTAARLLMREAAALYDERQPCGAEANMAKYLASTAALHAADAVIQLHGGYAFDAGYDIVSIWSLIRLTQVAPVNNEMVLNYVAEHVLGLPKSY